MEMEDQLTPTQIKIIAGWSHNYPCLVMIGCVQLWFALVGLNIITHVMPKMMNKYNFQSFGNNLALS